MEKESIVEVFSPIRRKPYPPAGYTGVRLYAELAELIRSRQSVIVFTNVRSAAEQIGLRLKELLPELADQIEIHHASLDRSVRMEVEDRLKNGELRAVVCSTSLELGIDIGAVDLVVMVATPKGVSRAIQRIGRSGHSLNQSSHGVLVATNINDLVEATATAQLVRRGASSIRSRCWKSLTTFSRSTSSGWPRSRRSRSTRRLPSLGGPILFATWSATSSIMSSNIWPAAGNRCERQYAGLFGKIAIDGRHHLARSSAGHARVPGQHRNNRFGGFVSVLLGRRRLGSVEEGFIKQLQIGDLFVLGGRVVRLIDTGVQEVLVERADGHLPTIPRWNAAKMPLTSGVANAVRNLRADLVARLRERLDAEAVDWLVETYQISIANAQAIVELFRAQLAISEVPAGARC